MMNSLGRYLCCLILLSGMIGLAQTSTPFEEGKEAYKNGNYRKAIDHWSSILKTDQHSAALYYNLGNAYYKLNEIGPSIFYYEKALQLAPGDRDIKNNLSFAQNARVDAIEPLPKTIFKVWYQRISGLFSYDGWARLSVVLSFLSATLFLLYYFSGSEKRKRVAFISSVVLGMFLVFCAGMAFLTFNDYKNDRPAIVFSTQVDVRSEPTVGGEAVFILHEGTKVQILDRDGEWARISIADGKDGWLPSSAIKELKGSVAF